jgi:glycerophosphoryl diester phosphodiesterase
MDSRTRRFVAPALASLATLTALTTIAPAAPPAAGKATSAVEQERTTGRAKPVSQLRTPLVLGHRGASGYRPEHTLAAYELAIRMGADYVEPDLVSTKDGKLVARHENEISGTTDVADRPEFADRRTTRTIDGVELTGWFTEDFTLAELKTLRAKERLPQVRTANTRYDGRYEVPTFGEVLRLVKRWEKKLGHRIGLSPEIKHPDYFDSIGLSMEEEVVRTLRKHGRNKANAKVVIQSFEVSNLKDLNDLTDVPLVQLTGATGGPADLADEGVTYASMTTPKGLRAVRRYADWLGPEKNQVLPRDAAGAIGEPSSLVRDAHRAGLRVSVYTVRDENQFLPANLRVGTNPAAHGDVFSEIEALLDAGVDGFFADMPDTGVAARDWWVDER